MIINNITENADKVLHDEEWIKDFSEKTLQEKKDELIRVTMSKHEIEVRKKNAMDCFKEELKPVNEIFNTLVEEISIGGEVVTGDLYVNFNFDEDVAEMCDESGQVMKTRKLTPSERQKTLFTELRKTGTNNL